MLVNISEISTFKGIRALHRIDIYGNSLSDKCFVWSNKKRLGNFLHR